MLEFEDVSFAYDDEHPILSGASFRIEEGEVVALVGSNGSGKSTVALLAGAFLLPSSGTVSFMGESTSSAIEKHGSESAMEMRSRMGFVMQNPDDQLVASIVVDEVAFGPSNLGVSRDEAIERVQHALDAVGMAEHVGRNVNTLSGGEKQRIAIADALAMRPRLMLLDEPTSMLDAQGREDVRRIITKLRDEGISALWITHSPEEAALADRVLAIEDGKVIETEPSRLRGASLGSNPSPKPEPNLESPIVEFKGVSFDYLPKNELGIDIFDLERKPHPVFKGLDLAVAEGETLAIIGSNGCGKSTLLQMMNGLLAPTSGEVLVCGAPTCSKEGANSARRNVGLCMQYPERSLFSQTVRDEIAFGPKNLGLEASEIAERVAEAMELVGLPTSDYAERNPFELSGGEQRKVALAGILAMHPRVLALDEPCSSLDAQGHAMLMELLLKLKENGQTMVMVTHDIGDVMLLADRVFDMGEIRAYSKR